MTSRNLGTAGSMADLPRFPQDATELVFTLYWTATSRWEGRNFTVTIEKPA